MILEMAFPHCIVRSFHYARVSLPTSGAAVTKPRDSPRLREEASWPPGGRCERPCVAWHGGTTHRVSTPSPQHGSQARGHLVGAVISVRQSRVSCPVAEAAGLGYSGEFSP